MRALASWCVRHRRSVVLIWLGLLVAVTIISSTVGTAYTQSFSLPNTESTRALNVLQAASPQNSGDLERVVFEVPAGQSVTDPSTKVAIESTLTRLAAVPHVASVVSPFSPFGAQQISKDGRIAFAQVKFNQDAFQIDTVRSQAFVASATRDQSGDLKIAVSGQVA